jgi:hypothetical protein
VARGLAPVEETTTRQLRLDITRNGESVDIALVDVVVYAEAFIASRAVWDMSKVREVMLTRASPGNIGLSSIGGGLHCKRYDRTHGVYIRLGEGEGPVSLTAPIAPGLVEPVHLEAYRLLNVGDVVEVGYSPSILALDGEREVKVREGDRVSVTLTGNGPLLIDMHKTLQEAARLGLMMQVNREEVIQSNCVLRALGLCIDPPEECMKEE